MPSLQEAIIDLHSRGEDLLALDVTTYVGEVTLEKTDPKSGEGQALPLDELFRMLKGPRVNAKLRLVAATHRGPDRDVASICADGLSESEKALLQAHKEMYLAAEEARASLVRLVLELVPKIT